MLTPNLLFNFIILRYYHQRPGRLFNSWRKLIRITKAPHYCLVLREIHRSNPLTKHPECLKRLKVFPGHDVVILKERKKHSLQPSPPWNILHWCHNEDDGVWNHRRHNYFFFNRLFRCRSKKTSKLRVTVFCEGNPPVTSMDKLSPDRWGVECNYLSTSKVKFTHIL